MVDERYNEKAAAQSLNSQVLGVYQPRTHRLMVRPGPITARLRITLVHELTHALDGEHHQLVRKTKSIRPDESGTSFRALAEGDAMWVESRYRATLSAADQAGATAADGPAPTGIPDALLLLAAYPYAAGRAFIEELVKQDGTDAVDRAFDHPPITSEQILHVDRYLGHDRPRVVVKPVPEGRVVQRGVFGELLLRLMLSRSLGADPARRAGTGWGGGRYVAWRSGTSVCVRGTLVMDTAADTDELVAALRQWATSRPRARVTPSPGRSVMFDNCVDA
jgi:hypothetical protein